MTNAFLEWGSPADEEAFAGPTPPVDCRYGAPMGRFRGKPDTSQPLYLRHVPLDSDGYDAGGAYWGFGQRLYATGDARDRWEYLRADGREHAKRLLRERYGPDLRFFR